MRRNDTIGKGQWGGLPLNLNTMHAQAGNAEDNARRGITRIKAGCRPPSFQKRSRHFRK